MIRHRRSTPKVRNGKTQLKNRYDSPGYFRIPANAPFQIIQERPGPAHQHLLNVPDVENFLDLLPARWRPAHPLRAIVLDRGTVDTCYCHWGYQGWYDDEMIGINAWPQDTHRIWTKEECKSYEPILNLLEITPIPWDDSDQEESADSLGYWNERGEWREHQHDSESDPDFLVPFTSDSARAFQLLYVVLRGLGHHRVHSSSRRRTGQACDDIAQHFLLQSTADIFPLYLRSFGDPRM